MSDTSVHGTIQTPVTVYGTGHLVADHVVLDGGGCALGVFAGRAEISNATLEHGGANDTACNPVPIGTPLSGGLAVAGGTVSLVDSTVLDPAVGADGVVVTGGTVTVDRTMFDSSDNHSDLNDSTGVKATGGRVTVTRSTITGFGLGTLDDGATALLSDDTFVGNTTGVTASSGQATVVRSTLTQELGSLQGTVSVAGSVLGADSIKNCNGTITDLGYNLAADETCDFTAGTSQSGVDGDLDSGLSDVGGNIETVAIRNPSVAVDSVQLTSTVSVPDVGVDGIGITDGTIVFRDGAVALCQATTDGSTGLAGCSTTGLATGKHHLSATYYPAAGTIVDTSAAPTFRLVRGRVPHGLTPDPEARHGHAHRRPTASGVGRHVLRLKAFNLMGHVTQTLAVVVRRG